MPRKITTIPATIDMSNTYNVGKTKRRVAAYARVSTENEEQQTSYEAQVDYYTTYIKSRNDWQLVEVYTDEGITGTNTKHREGFKRMVADALDRKIDLIVTKSVSRFARNTVDSLTTIRKLKEKNIECYFEKENIWTFDGKGELLITIMSSLAQEESRSISENVKWGRRKQFADGKVTMNYGIFLGYERGKDGNLAVNEEQAKIIRKIYKYFIEGLTPHTIAKELTRQNIVSPAGKKAWNEPTIRSILKNEKYKGDALLQKSYTVDFLTKKKKINQGEVPQYYVENNHEAIISKEVFETVQIELAKRKAENCRYSGVNIFAAKIRCGECGYPYGSKIWHSTSKYRKVVYQCNHKFLNVIKCKTPHLLEEEIKELFIKAVNKLLINRQEILANLELVEHVLFNNEGLETKHKKLQEEIKKVAAHIQSCVTENAMVAQDQIKYEKRYNDLAQLYEVTKANYEDLGKKINNQKSRGETLRAFINSFSAQNDLVTEFDIALWGSLLDRVMVYTKNDVRFIFKDGTEITI